MIELQLGTSAVGGRTPYLIHHKKRLNGDILERAN